MLARAAFHFISTTEKSIIFFKNAQVLA